MAEKGADVDAEYPSGQTPLFAAANHNDVALAEALLAKRADVNHTSRNGNTPLHSAAINFRKEVASYLIEHGAKLDARNKKGLTPLEYARSRKAKPKSDETEQKAAMVQFLEAQGAQ
jgi:ankyrin repeat protein